MTNVSKNKLPKEIRNKLFTQFSSLFVNSNQCKVSSLFESIFTDSEKIMFIKRLAIVLMISEGYSTYAISKALKVSDSTVRTLQSKFRIGEYDALVKTTQHGGFDHKKFWTSVETLLTLGMPSYSGKHRWKGLDRNLNRGK